MINSFLHCFVSVFGFVLYINTVKSVICNLGFFLLWTFEWTFYSVEDADKRIIQCNLDYLIYFVGEIKFTSKYDGKAVTGLVGSSVNFTWSFSGDVLAVVWGLKKDGLDVIKHLGELASLNKYGSVPVTVPSAYSGRVSGSGDASSGQVTFTLSSIRMSDKGFYGCKIKPTGLFDQESFDSVYLAVKGEHLLA